MVIRVLKNSFLLGLLFILTACGGGGAFAPPGSGTDPTSVTNASIASYGLEGQRLFTEKTGETEIEVRAYDSIGSAVSDAEITVTVEGDATSPNGSTFTARTNENGAIFIPIVATQAGITTVTVDSGTLVGRFDIYFGASVTSTRLENGQPANGSSPITIIVRALDHEGRPIVGLDGSLSFSPGSFAVAVNLPTETDNNGVYAVDITDTRAETLTVTPILGDFRTQPLSLTFNASDSISDPANVTLSLSANNILADGTATAEIIVIARDASGTPIVGIDVSLSSSSGSALLANAKGVTGNNGAFSTSISNTVAETVQIRATAGAILSEAKNISFVSTNEVNVASVSVEVNGNSAFANGTDAVQLTIYAKDTEGNPVPNANISFRVSGGSAGFSADSGVTDSLGRFVLSITDTIVETFTVTPMVGDISGEVVNVVFRSSGDGANSVPSNIDLIVTSDNQRADGTAQINLIVVVRDQNNTPLSGSAVVLSSTSSSAQFGAVSGSTNAGGSFTTTVTNNIAGNFTITASSGAVNDTETVTFIAVPQAETVEVNLSNNNQFANGSDAVTLTAIVRNQAGRPVPDAPVFLVFSANATGRPSSAVPAAASGVTDAGGAFVTTITDTMAESFTVQVVVEGTQIQKRSDLLVFKPAPSTTAPASVDASSDLETQVADGAAEIQVIVVARDANGTPIQDVDVSLASSSGSALINPASGSTGPDGAFTATVTNTKPETLTLTPTAGGIQGNVLNLNFTPSLTVTPATVTLNVANDNATANGQAEITLTVVVRSDLGTPVVGVPVSLSSDSLTALFSSSTGASGITDAGGTFTTSMTNTVSETVTLIPTAGGITGQPTAITFQGAISKVPTNMQLLTSSPQLLSEGNAEGVLITALLKTGDNNPFAGATVRFSADSGSIQVVKITDSDAEAGVTDSSGRAQARLTTQGNAMNRDIIVTASSGALSQTITIQVVGTELSIVGADSSTLGSQAEYSVFLTDSSGSGIGGQQLALSSALNNPIVDTSGTNFVTDNGGRVIISLTAQNAGTDTLTVSGANATPTNKQITISDDNFVVSRDDGLALETDIPTNISTSFTVTWNKNGSIADVIGKTINISATRGTLSTNVASIALTGDAHFSIQSDNAGPTTITVSTDETDGPSRQFSFDFIAEVPNSIELQANPSTVGINTGGSTAEQSTIIAVVRDAKNNLVKGKMVEFTLNDITGGNISPSAAMTDQFGRASTVYTAGAIPSAQDGVRLQATVVENPNVSNEVLLTVAQRGVFISLGTGNSIIEPNATVYEYPYTVLVNDINGAPVSGAAVTLSAVPTRYFKGFRYLPESVTADGWVTVYTVPNGCVNEDLNNNGLLEPNEDVNQNGRLDPGNVITFEPDTVVTDSNGFASFNLVYPQENASWLEVNLTAKTVVSGSEDSDSAIFVVGGSASDFASSDLTPPGTPSPYGVGGNSSEIVAGGASTVTLNEQLLGRDANGNGTATDVGLPATCLYDQ